MNPTPDQIREARAVIRAAFEHDSHFRQTYVDNIAMVLYDGKWVTNYQKRNAAAEAILKHILERE